MILQAGDLLVELDNGAGSADEVLHRLEEGRWVVYKVSRKLVRHPVEVESLPPGQYRMVKP